MRELEKYMEKIIFDLKDDRLNELYLKLPSGKRLRAKLVLKIANKDTNSLKLASIIELIHAASLLHDDVIDDANTRRGKSSLNAIFGNKTAIMTGDILYAKAFFELSSFSKDIAQIISNAVCELSVGELMDVEMSKTFNDNEQKYMTMIYKKTASLIEATTKSAAILAQKDEQKYGKYGKNLGLAFQIIDDVLDLTQSREILGKPSLNDFREGKTTLPYIYLYQSLNEKNKEKLKSMFGKDLKNEDKIWIQEKMQKYGVIEKSKQKAKFFAEEALSYVGDLKELKEIVEKMIQRDF